MTGQWPLERTPRVGALRRTAGTLTALPAAAVAIRVDPDVDPSDAQALTRRCVGVRLVLHPSLTAVAETAGAQVSPQKLTFPLRADVTDPQVWEALVRAVHPAAWASDLDTTAATQDRPAVTGPSPGPARLSVTRTRTRLTVHGHCDPIQVSTTQGSVRLTMGRTVRVFPTQVPTLVHAARRAGLVIVDADLPGRLVNLGWTHDRRLVVTPVPGALGWAHTDVGPFVTATAAPVTPAVDAVTHTRPAVGKIPVVVDPLVSASADGTSAGPVPSPTDGVVLRSWQELFVGRYVANGVGLVNALPPGSGKTVCVAAAMAHLAASTKDVPHRGLVVAPTSLMGQWVRELAVFHPSAKVTTLSTETDVSKANRVWSTHRGPVVAVTSPGVVTGHVDRLARWRVEDLVVDEGTFLRADSAQTRALWRLRDSATRAVVLTGTPEAGGDRTVEELTRFVAGHHPQTPTGPLPEPLAGLPALERAGGWVFGLDQTPTEVFPVSSSRVPLVPGSQVEDTLHQVATGRVRGLLGQLAGGGAARARRVATSVRSELERWRVGVACPAALLAGSSSLARAFTTALEDQFPGVGEMAGAGSAVSLAERFPWLVGVKVPVVVQQVTEAVRDGGQVLVFADAPGVLEVLGHQLGQVLDPAVVGVLSGRVRPAARAEAVEQFTQGRVRVLLVSSVGQWGLNLQMASHLVHADVPASAAVLAQRSARAVRMGATVDQVSTVVPLVEGSAEQVWWAHTSGVRAATDILGLGRELADLAR